MKRFLSLVLVMCIVSGMLFSLSTNVIAESIWGPDPIEEGFYSYIVIDNEAAIVDVDKDDISGNIIIPNTLGGYPVTTIWDTAFFGCDNLTGVTIPKGIKKIESMAFGRCSNLSKINIADGVTDFAGDAFYNTAFYDDANNWENNLLYIGNYLLCGNNINSAKIKEGTTIICNGAFDYCNYLQEVYIPESVTHIGNEAFYSSSLKEINIPTSVTYIGDYAFSGTQINSVIISEHVTYIGHGAFACPKLTDITISTHNKKYCSIDGHLFTKDKKTIIQYAIGKKDDTYTIPDGVTSIGDGAFYHSNNLKEVIISDTVESIGNNAFTYAEIEKITIPSNVKNIGDSAFWQNRKLTSITIMDGLQTIGEEAFYGCDSLQQILIPDSVVKLGEGAFKDCPILKEIQLSKNLTVIESRTFDGCRMLKEIVIPENVKTIKSSFAWCENLLTVTLGCNVEKIDQWAFSNCKSLANIFVSESNPYLCDINGNVFSKDKKTIILYAPGKTETIYNIPDGVLRIGERAFTWNENLCEITMPNSVTALDINAFHSCENLVKVNLSNGLLEISVAAFENCTSLKEIKLPESLTHIGDYAFSRCSSLENINIPSKVTQIEPYTFTSCSALKNVKLHDNITKIGYDTFSGCESLTNITIPKGLTEIPWNLFDGCSNLSRIFIPDSVEYIGGSFNGCTALSDIYYSGSKEDWEKIFISDYGNYCLANATIHYNSEMPNYKEPSQKSGTFNFASEFGNGKAEDGNSNGKAEDGNSIGNYTYDDNYFADSSYTYNHNLAKMSLNFAMSAFANHKLSETDIPSGVTGKYSQQYKNAYALLDEVGFENIFYNDCYIKEPTTNSIGVISGSKKIAYDNGDYTLIAVAIRGNGYEKEWGGNFNVGAGKAHLGFSLARNQVLQHIKDYIDNNNINGKIKLWITGFSRAAATTNLTAAYIDENLTMFGDNVSLDAKDLFAYCFETPAGTSETNKSQSLYGNIFSIVNTNDFVPMVVMSKWGYGRYGITKYIPSELTMHTQQYNELFSKVKTQYKQLTKEKYHDYLIDDFVSEKHGNNQGVFLSSVMDNLADAMVSSTEYSIYFEDAIMTLAGEALGGDKEIVDKLLKKILNKIEENRSKLIAASAMTEIAMGPIVGTSTVLASDYIILRMIIKESLQEMNINFFDDTKIDRITLLLARLWLNGTIDILKNNAENLDGLGFLAQGHYPELCLAWLEAMDESDLRTGHSRVFHLNCPVDLEVYDSSNKLVAAVYDNVPQEIEDSSIVAYVDENGQKVVYLPTDEEYRIEVTATDDGEVTYSVQEKNADSGETRIVNYNNMVIAKDDKLTGVAENLTTTENALYTLSSDTVEISEQEIIENAHPIAITVDCKGNGNVSGGGNLYKGEFAQLAAAPYENESFIGWYNGDILVSNEETYRFQVTDTVTLTAKFTENTCEILYLTDDEDVVAIERILKGTSADFPDMTCNPNYMILGIYTDKDYTNLADENAIYSADTVLYAKVLNQDEWVQFDKTNNKIKVYSSVAMDDVKLMVATYDNNRLNELKSVTTDLAVGENVFDNPIINPEAGDTIKIMVWENLSTLTPLYNVCVSELD